MTSTRVEALQQLPVWKGHGTENDFVIIDDRDDTLDLSDELVRALCDRRTGIGADGVLRVVRRSSGRLFMDYRNADGSIAEMCGNGARVFGRYLQVAGLVAEDAFSIDTRAGSVDVRLERDGQVTVSLGPAGRPGSRHQVSVAGLPGVVSGEAVTMPNPHVVVVVDSLVVLAGLDLSTAPVVEPPLPAGQNVEFVVRTAPRALSLRVHERGAGETRSCGTGIGAAVVAAQSGAVGGTVAREPANAGADWQVHVPGGRLRVRWDGAQRVYLTGPAVLVARIVFDASWLTALDETVSAASAES